MQDDERSTASAARSPELQALLRDLDELRLSLATDLSLAAAALEAGSPEIAGAVVDTDRAELERFRQRALRHLAEVPPVEVPPVEVAPDEVAPDEVHPVEVGPVEVGPVAVPRRRRSLMTAVAPLVATAAAVLGVLAGVVPTGGPEPASGAGTTAMASYQEVTQLSRDGAKARDIARAAQRLHDELAAIVASASSDPAAVRQALAMLESEFRVLDSSADREQLSAVLAEARELLVKLRAALPATVTAPVRPPALPLPTTAVDELVLPVEAPSAPLLPVPLPPAPDPSPEPSPSAAPAPSPSAPSPSPTGSTPSPSPSAPAPGPAPSGPAEPGGDQDGVLPDAVLPPD